jgi:uncharacterized protein
MPELSRLPQDSDPEQRLGHPHGRTGTRMAMPVASALSSVNACATWFVVAATAVVLTLVTGLNLTLRFYLGWYAAVDRSTGNLVTPTLLATAFLVAAVLIGLIRGGRLSWHDIGWRSEQLVPGLVVVVTVWLASQFVEIVACYASGDDLRVAASWSGARWAVVVGAFLAQALGTAPAEETFYRGFLLPQIWLKLTARPSGRLALAITLSQVVFALSHLPNLILGLSGSLDSAGIALQVVTDFLIGLLLAALYLRTGNLFLVMGIHALANAPTSLIAPIVSPSLVILGLGLVILIAAFAAPARSRRLPKLRQPR